MNPHLNFLSVSPRHLRSANVEHDTQTAMAEYILTGRSLELLRRIVGSISEQNATRAWAVTGPYGTGKSSFALLLTALLCRTGAAHEHALFTVSRTDPLLAEHIATLTRPLPILRAAVTARREPLIRTVARGLMTAADSDEALSEQVGGLDLEQLQARDVVGLVAGITARRPLLILLDEFGKNLEYFSEETVQGDLFLLQELAELAAGSRTLHPLTLVTLQHAPYADYLSGAGAVQRREWHKVQGRFMDVSYTEDAGDVASIVAGTVVSDLSSAGHDVLEGYARKALELWSSLGLSAVLAADTSIFGSTYPIHPVALASLPVLCATLGQHDRTLAGFLTGDEPHTLARFLQAGSTAHAPEVLGTLRLDTIYDYFDGTVNGLGGRAASRWREITSRVESASQLPDLDHHDLALLKTVGLLNVIGAGGALRASLGVIALAVTDPQEATPEHRQCVAVRCQRLVDQGFLTYRRHDDEYRMWAGTDIDIEARVAELRDQFSDAEVAHFLSADYLPAAVVAGRHSQEHGMLRYFQPVVLDSTATFARPEHGTRPDGLMVFHLGDHESPAADLTDLSPLPLLLGSTDQAATVRSATDEALALGQLLGADDLDPIARAEVRDRLASAKAALTTVFASAFDPAQTHAQWTLRLPGHGKAVHLGPYPSMSALASAATDTAYPQSPRIRSEMLGRHQLTSQGAKARREVLTALLKRPESDRAGLTGNGPDMAVYQGVVAYLDLHGKVADKGQGHGWTEPMAGRPGNARPAYQRLVSLIHSTEGGINVADLAEHLVAPPFGLKAGVFPLLVTAVIGNDPDIAVFEDGTFQTALSPDLIERMVKVPSRFVLRHQATRAGQPAVLIAAIGEALDVAQLRVRPRTRNPGIVLVAAALLGQVATLSEHTRRTQQLSKHATALRVVLLQARDPAALLLHELPVAVGSAPVDIGTPVDPPAAEQIASTVRNSLNELLDADAALLRRIVQALGTSLTAPKAEATEARAALAELAGGIVSIPSDPVLRSFVQHARQDALDDEDWYAQAAMIVTNQPPSQWREEHEQAFIPAVRHLIRAMERLYALHLEDHHDGQARRLTLTGPDGSEEHLVLHSGTDPDVDRLLDTMLAASRAILGPQAERRLLGALAARTLTQTTN